MKKHGKSIVLWGLFAVGTFAGAERAQAQSASASVEASAVIEAFLDVTHEQDLAFGNILPAAGTTLTPGTAPGAGQAFGRLRIQHNSAIAISATLPTGLSLAGFADLPVSFTCGFADTPGGTVSGSVSACDALPNHAANGDGSTRTSYLEVGGGILAGDTQDRAPGIYTGTLVFQVTAVY